MPSRGREVEMYKLQYRTQGPAVNPLLASAADDSFRKGPGTTMSKSPIINSNEPKQIVFVVDDDVDVREGLRSLLDSVRLGCEVFASAMEFLNRKPSDASSCRI